MKTRYILYMLAVALCVISCGKQPDPIIEPVYSEGRVTLEVSAEEILIKSRGGKAVLDVLTNQDGWTWSADDDSWLDITSDKYFLYIEAGRNETDMTRVSTVTISAGEGDKEVSATLTVTQNHSGVPEITVDDNSLRVKAYTGLVNTIEVETNQEDWTYDCTCSWLLVEQKDNMLVLTADCNETFQQRTAEIELKAGYGENVDSEVLTVKQDGTAFIILSTHNVTADDQGKVRSVEISANPELEWSFESDGSDWFSAERNGSSLEVSIQSSDGEKQRMGSITVSVGDEDNNASAILKVRQIGKDTEELIYEVLVSEPDYFLTGAPVITSSTGGTVTVDWGDGSEKETFESRRPTHVYKEPGLYTIEMTGSDVKSLEFSSGESVSYELQNVVSWGKMGYTTLVDMCLGCGGLKSIPNDVAGSFENVKSFLGAFSCCESLEEIPSGLFRYAVAAKNFEDCFSHSASISEIPEGLFANCAAAQDFSYTFYGTGSGYILTTNTLANFDEVRSLVSVGKIKNIPGGLFRNCPEIKQMDYVFGATSVTSVPEDIFAGASKATIFTGAFSSCVNLTEVPVGFMADAISATDIKYMFAGCESLKTFPAGAFISNTAVTNLEYIFYKTGFERLPGGIFEGLVNVKTIGAVFQDCVSLTDVSPDTFKGLTGAKSFKYCFSGCTSLRQLPSDLFAGLTLAYEFKSTFEDTALESVPADLFKDSRDYSSADLTYVFAGCKNLKTVPAAIFNTFTKVTSPGFKNAFEGSGIEVIPAGLFSKNTAVSSGFEETFYNCTSLKTIEGPIFAETSSVSSLAYMFCGCTSLTEIPEGMFEPLATSKTKYTAVFKNCSSLKTLPKNLFSSNTLATQFVEAFRGCTSLKSIPEGLFGINEKLTQLRSVFAECTSLTSLPADLFAGTPAITSFEAAFSGCSSLESLPESLFSAIGTKTTSITFSDCFKGCSSLKSLPAGLFDTVTRINYIDGCFDGCSSLTGESPYTLIGDAKIHLYERQRGTDFPNVPSTAYSHEACFAGCHGLSDYDDIPVEWR